ncbi:MAG: hypothetical protein JSR13_05845 [Proteobacteria bacterium]|nr:hypothetical protein [Pseudomonadota bacterium]
MRSFFRSIAEKWAARGARAAVDKFSKDTLPSLVEGALIKNFKASPNSYLPEGWFNLCLAYCLKTHWPDVDEKTAIRWLREYIGVRHGSPGYEWTYASAEIVASEYAMQFGEPS